MTTKQRFRNGRYRLEIREKDHLPSHAHLSGGGLDIVIDLETMNVTEGVWPASLKQEVMEWVVKHQKELIEEWKKWRP
ncbi:MAG: DUF4160 domain-containing protein [Candidatus Riflebacteria bacterium]|nr:DUF4160 domain-containing protein [Candidatus Riflebacteria bacterium]